MLRNYIVIAWRNLWKNKVFSLINILGLSVGITCCLLIALYVRHELSYDRFQEKGARTVRVIMDYGFGGSRHVGNFTSMKVGPSLLKNFPEVEAYVRMETRSHVVRYGDNLFVEKRFVYADSSFFRMFSFPVLSGNVNALLSEPNTVVLTTSTAQKYFGNEDPVGKILKVSSAGTAYRVTGVVADCPANSQIKFGMVASLLSYGTEFLNQDTYWNANYITYLLLKGEAGIASLQAKIPGFMDREMRGKLGPGDHLSYQLEPMYDVHLYSEHSGFELNGSITYVYILGLVAGLILLIASFTFVNLSTARSVERAREIGIRKVSGAGRAHIFWQFIGESFLLVLIAACISTALAFLFLPAFGHMMDRELQPAALASSGMIAFSVLLVLCLSFLAGAYPALVLSAFRPVTVLKGMFKNQSSGLVLRHTLFVIQFVVSVFLISTAIGIRSQLHYIQHKKLGFERERVLVLPYDARVHQGFNTLKTELKQNPSVAAVARADFQPFDIQGGYSMSKTAVEPRNELSVFAASVDQEYIQACGIELLHGTGISERDVTDAMREGDSSYYHFVLNETAARVLGWTPEEAVGKKLFLGTDRPGEVKGVVKDFHFASLHTPIAPLVLFPGGYGGFVFVKLSGNDATQGLAHTRSTWEKVMTHRPFEYTLMADDYTSVYKAENQIGEAMTVFTILAIVLAALGLFGLSSYSIQQRTKEIGILKVLGAPVPVIVMRLSKRFVWLVLLAIAIAVPLAWLALVHWLGQFSYRIEVGAGLFIAAGLLAVLLAVLTVSLRALRAAMANPVKNLRTE